MAYIFTQGKAQNLPQRSEIIQPGQNVTPHQSRHLLPPITTIKKVKHENIFKKIDNWYAENLEAKDTFSLLSGVDKLAPSLYKTGPFPNLVGRPRPQNTAPRQDTIQRWQEIRQDQQEAAKYAWKPYRYQHYPWPDIIGTARADIRNRPEYRSKLSHEQVLEKFRKAAG